MLFRVKHLFTTVSFLLMFSITVFDFFVFQSFNESSMDCMAHIARICDD